jgi:hypothetical protein
MGEKDAPAGSTKYIYDVVLLCALLGLFALCPFALSALSASHSFRFSQHRFVASVPLGRVCCVHKIDSASLEIARASSLSFTSTHLFHSLKIHACRVRSFID